MELDLRGTNPRHDTKKVCSFWSVKSTIAVVRGNPDDMNNKNEAAVIRKGASLRQSVRSAVAATNRSIVGVNRINHDPLIQAAGCAALLRMILIFTMNLLRRYQMTVSPL